MTSGGFRIVSDTTVRYQPEVRVILLEMQLQLFLLSGLRNKSSKLFLKKSSVQTKSMVNLPGFVFCGHTVDRRLVTAHSRHERIKSIIQSVYYAGIKTAKSWDSVKLQGCVLYGIDLNSLVIQL